jgi:Rps23 Pro-64 3,4-dihydroxylase Tpa1-like proline 4-hydroxylase
MELNRSLMAGEICKALDRNLAGLANQWRANSPISHFVVDDLLPEDWASRICRAFPRGDSMTLRKSLREVKFVTAQMNRHDPLLEEAIYAFQMPEVVSRVGEITRLRALEPDTMLYAGGISMMGRGHFLNPHIDNSHDMQRQRYRVLNLLYYVSPGWKEGNGCNLELWPDGPTGKPITLVSRFNRMVVMVTHEGSWHSVSRNLSDEQRCCVSNYYFSKFPVGEQEYFHVTSFRGRPEQPVRDAVLRVDGFARQMIRKLFPLGVKQSKHFYDRKPPP